MTWLIEVDTDRISTGPLHGELANVISDALDAYAPGYATRVGVTWRVDEPSP